jgi:BirA family biotin operon repressor/biotin-[acetyl-CoA-carboxylase] ligase
MEIWQKLIKLDSVDSTNEHTSNILKQKKLPEGSIFFSMSQTAGKGLGSNTWEGEKGKNLLLSIVLHPSFLEVKDQFLLSKAVSLGISNYCDTKTDDIKIKWPNDIYYQNKKLAGILIENSIKGSKIEKSIVGIGLNLNQELFVSNAPNPISLKNITGIEFEIDKELLVLRDFIQDSYLKLKTDRVSLNKLYLGKMFRYNEFHLYKIENQTLELKITGVNEFGHLQTISLDGVTNEFDLKEIEFVL